MQGCDNTHTHYAKYLIFKTDAFSNWRKTLDALNSYKNTLYLIAMKEPSTTQLYY